MKANKILKVLFVVIWILQLAVEGLTAALILRLDMLPTKFLIPVLVLLALLWLCTGLLLLAKRKGREASFARMVVGGLLALLVVAGCTALSGVIADLDDTMSAISKPNQLPENTTVSMAVYVAASDPAQTLADTRGYVFGYLDGYEAARVASALEIISEKLGAQVSTTGFTAIQDMASALIQGDAKALILNSAYVSLLEEQEELKPFVSQIRLLEEITIEVEAQDPESTLPGGEQVTDRPEYEPPKPKDVTNTPFVVYISGSDTRSDKLSKSNSDVNILVVVNPSTKQILLLNTPRDYYISNPAGGGAMDKLTHCGGTGVDCSMEVLGDLYGVDVNYYAQINFQGFKTLVDAVGGVTVYSDAAFSAGNGQYYIEKGDNFMDGDKALAFARERYHVSGGDNGRGKNQMKVIQALVNKMTSGTTIITRYGEILDSLEGMFVTDFDREEINKLVKMQLSDMSAWNISSFAVGGEGASREVYSLPGFGPVYVTLQDPELVAQAAGLVDKVMAGKTLTEEDLVPVH